MSDDTNAILILYQSNQPKFKKAETKQVMQGSKCSVILVPENIFTIYTVQMHKIQVFKIIVM